MKHIFLFCLLFGLSICSAFAQTKKTDSLRAVLVRHPQQDTFRVNRLYDLAIAEGNKNWPPANPTYLDSLTTQASLLARQLNYPYGQARALHIKSLLRYIKGNREGYQTILKQALPLAQQSGDKPLLSTLLTSLGSSLEGKQQQAYFQQAQSVARSTNNKQLIFNTYTQIINFYSGKNYALALQWALSLLTEVEKDTNTIHQYNAVSLLAGIYKDLKEYDQALPYLQRSQQIGRKRGDKAMQGAALTRIGNIYLRKGQPDQAIKILQNGLSFVAKTRLDRVIEIEGLLAECYEQKGQTQQALVYAHRALARIRTNEDQLGYFAGLQYQIWLTLSKLYLHTHQPDSARYYCNKLLPISQSDANMGFWESTRDVTNVLAQVYAQKGNYTKAYQYQNRSIAYTDSLNNEEVTRKATAMRFTDQMSRQQSQIIFLNKTKQIQEQAARQQKILILFLMGTLLMLGVLAWSLLRNNRQKQRANALLQTQRDQTEQALTELKATQQQLVQKEKMASLGELTAGIAHEIQNPLNFVNNFSEVSTELVTELEEEQLKPSRDSELEAELLGDLRQNLQKITQHGQRASSIVKGMLEHSRSSTGEVQLTDLNALADEYLRLAYHGQRAKDKEFNCELVTQFDPNIGKVKVMSQEIGRVLLNLFTNAFYAVRERRKQGDSGYQPKVSIRTSKTKAGIEIQVSDNGTGMAEAVKQKIFQPFFTTKPTGEGTGLGLSLSYGIITKGHGGTMEVQSKPGEGTQMTLRLPA